MFWTLLLRSPEGNICNCRTPIGLLITLWATDFYWYKKRKQPKYGVSLSRGSCKVSNLYDDIQSITDAKSLLEKAR
jgi:hypothetical protein